MEKDTVKAMLEAFANKPVIFTFDKEHQVMVVPKDAQTVDMSKFLPPPERIEQRVELLSVESFNAYVNRYWSDCTFIFANEPQAQYEAVIDYHDSDDAAPAGGRGYCDHVAFYTCPPSEQYKRWTGSSGKMMGQVEFAQFIEESLPDISSPPGAELLQLALELQVHKSAAFESEIRLDNGQTRFRYLEEVRGTSKAGDIQIPSTFTIGIPVFVDGEAFAFPARFRYRMNEGKLALGYELIRPKDVYSAAVKQVTSEISEGTPDKVELVVGLRR